MAAGGQQSLPENEVMDDGELQRQLSQPLARTFSTASTEQAWAGTASRNLKRMQSLQHPVTRESSTLGATQSQALDLNELGFNLQLLQQQYDIEDIVRKQIANTLHADDEEELLNRSKKSVVKLFVQSVSRNPLQPWVGAVPTGCTGSGFAFELGGKKRIMTNAHVVGAIHARVQVEVEKYGDSRKYLAHVLAQGNLDDNGYDLAVVDVPDESFWSGVVLQSLNSDSVPELMSKVIASGFPMGGDGLCNTVGAVSRIATDPQSHLLQIQIDAAINPGNSGGPVFDKEGKVVGISVAIISGANNICFVISLPVVQTFLRTLVKMLKSRIEPGSGETPPAFYVPHPCATFVFQDLQNPRMREKLKMSPDQSGVLFIPPQKYHTSFVYKNSIQAGDVILKINGSTVGNDGTVVFQAGREERVTVRHELSRVAVGEDLEFTILRKGEVVVEKTEAMAYDHAKTLKPLEWKFTYCIIGGLVFIPCTKNMSSVGIEGYLDSLESINKTDEKQEVIVLGNILPAAQVNAGSDRMKGSVLLSFNGKPIQSLSHLQSMVDAIMATVYKKAQVVACFKKFDTKGDGKISPDELQEVVKLVDTDNIFSEATLQELLKDDTIAGDGQVDYVAFADRLTKGSKEDAGSKDPTDMDFKFHGGYRFILNAKDCLQCEPALCHHFGIPPMAWREQAKRAYL